MDVVALITSNPRQDIKEVTVSFQGSVIVILPETKSISLERTNKLFGELDAVDEGEEETSANTTEAITQWGLA